MKRSKTRFRRPIQFQSSSRRRPGAPVVPERSHFKLSLFGTLLRDPQSAAIKAELKWLTGELGPARELRAGAEGGIRTGEGLSVFSSKPHLPNNTIAHHDAPGVCCNAVFRHAYGRLGSKARITAVQQQGPVNLQQRTSSGRGEANFFRVAPPRSRGCDPVILCVLESVGFGGGATQGSHMADIVPPETGFTRNYP